MLEEQQMPLTAQEQQLQITVVFLVGVNHQLTQIL